MTAAEAFGFFFADPVLRAMETKHGAVRLLSGLSSDKLRRKRLGGILFESHLVATTYSEVRKLVREATKLLTTSLAKSEDDNVT